MPSLRDAVGINLAEAGYIPVEPKAGAAGSPPGIDQQPGFSPFMRCPLPPVWTASPDSLRQFYTRSIVPQTRLLSPSSTLSSGGGTTTATAATSSSSSSSSTTTTATIKASQASLVTALLVPNGRFVKSILLSKSFQLLSVSVNGAARIQLYGTATAQSLDAARAVDDATPAGTTQNIIADVVLDTAPYQWSFQDRVGANSDTPQTNTVYITVTNVGVSPVFLTVTLTYVPLENT